MRPRHRLGSKHHQLHSRLVPTSHYQPRCNEYNISFFDFTTIYGEERWPPIISPHLTSLNHAVQHIKLALVAARHVERSHRLSKLCSGLEQHLDSSVCESRGGSAGVDDGDIGMFSRLTRETTAKHLQVITILGFSFFRPREKKVYAPKVSGLTCST